MNIFIKEIDVGTAPSYGAIWDDFCEKHQHNKLKHYI